MFFTFCTVCNFRGRTLALGRVRGGRGRIEKRFFSSKEGSFFN